MWGRVCKGSGSVMGSVILIPVLLALLGSFGSSCWFGHDDLGGEENETIISDSISSRNHCKELDTAALVDTSPNHHAIHQVTGTLLTLINQINQVLSESMKHAFTPCLCSTLRPSSIPASRLFPWLLPHVFTGLNDKTSKGQGLLERV